MGVPRSWMGWECFVLVLAAALLGSHGLHLSADPATRMGWHGPADWSGDLFTDEGWAASGATSAILRGHWYRPGDFNLAVDAPMWSAMLYLPFKAFGVRIALARGIACGLYAGTITLLWSLVRRKVGRSAACVVALLLSANFLTMNFTRLAIMESAWIFFLVLSLFIAQRRPNIRSGWQPWVAGVVLGLAVLTKLTALCGIVPLLVVLYHERDSQRGFAGRASLACFGAAILVFPYRVWVIRHFAEDHRLYTKINVLNRSVGGVAGFVRQSEMVMRVMLRLDVALASCLLLGVIFVVVSIWRRFRHPRQSMNVVTAVCLGWLLANVAVCSTVKYFPPRYCVSLMVPTTVLAVVWTTEVIRRWKVAGYCMAGLLAFSLAFNLVGTLNYEAHPVYSFQAMSNDIERIAKADKSVQRDVMGSFGNTISLFVPLRSTNDDLGTTTRLRRIMDNHPSYFVTCDPASIEAVRDFGIAGGNLNLERRFDVLQNYSSGQPVYFYTVRWKPVGTGTRPE